ncbi:unnamed protein product [Linum trigynum]|uniref:SLH domain-containing protein n=1 Tax=Linum trigynum TaxID=586398 RepID=A0AAV2F3U5_9ROSI
MSSSSATGPPSSLFLRPSGAPSLSPHRNAVIPSSSDSFVRCRNPRLLRLSASVADGQLDLSWFIPTPNPPTPDGRSSDDFNGWAVVEAPASPNKRKKGLPRVVIGGIGVCVAAAAVAAAAYFSFSRNGAELQLRSPWGAAIITSEGDESEAKDLASRDEDVGVLEAVPESVHEPPVASQTPASAEKSFKVSVALDSTQLESLASLQKLKIVEDDIRVDELCTRREYARWLVRLNSLLERNPKHRIVPTISLSGSLAVAFDDISVDDPDFVYIQALAEAGIIPSKLSSTSLFSVTPEDGSFYFNPDRYLSRKDMINWRAQLEYAILPGTKEQMSRIRADYMDVKDISSDTSPEFFADMLTGEKSIIRKVFGQSRRFQPNKPSTKAQAAVTLTSGRMAEAVQHELLRMEAESSSRQAAAEEIKSELLVRGDIKNFWNEKLLVERNRGVEVQKLYIATLQDLDKEKDLQAQTLTENMKEKAAMDCQRHLILTLREEIEETSERLASERATYVAEQCHIQELRKAVLMDQEGVIDSKSILEAEVEALRILRTWVEDEAKKSQARAKVLEEVGRRWKWDNQA